MKRVRIFAAILILLICGIPVLRAQLPDFSPGGPDAETYGSAENFPVGSTATAFEKKFMVGSFSHFYAIFPGSTVQPAAKPWEFHRLSPAPEITYAHAGGRYVLKDYLQHIPVTVYSSRKMIRSCLRAISTTRTDRGPVYFSIDGKEYRRNARKDSGIGTRDWFNRRHGRKIRRELKDSDYGKVSVRDLLHMSSGVNCKIPESEEGAVSLRTLARDCKQAVPEGTRFRYSAADSEVLGRLVSGAVQKPLARYLQEKIWQEIGTESKAVWTTDRAGRNALLLLQCYVAGLARFARLLANNGAWNGKQLIPKQWILDATTVKEGDSYLQPGKSITFFGYGYQMWVFPGYRRMFALIGANGQRIFVDPQTKLILVQTAVMEKPWIHRRMPRPSASGCRWFTTIELNDHRCSEQDRLGRRATQSSASGVQRSRDIPGSAR